LKKQLTYLSGFNNQHRSEALKNALPEGQNSPQQCPYGLYAEQINGSAFTVNRCDNLRSWLYRIKPSVVHKHFKPYQHETWTSLAAKTQSPEQARWAPLSWPDKKTDFIDAQITYVVNGNIASRMGGSVQLFACNQSMKNKCFSNSDAEMLLVIETGELLLTTEMGLLHLVPGEITVIPRGIKFSVELITPQARGYLAENYGQPFRLPELGVIGANGLANPRDFLYPVAAFNDTDYDFHFITKFQGAFWQTQLDDSPFNVVAWHGNYAPYKYDLSTFNTINSVSFDHPDPSIFTVLTSPSNQPGTANMDFAIFPERWVVTEHTFRPPYYHRNIMSEFMGLIKGTYDAKAQGFNPGGASLHNCMSAHGPDKAAFINASKQPLTPEYHKDTLAFMFESSLVWQQTTFATNTSLKQADYLTCWENLPKNFKRSYDDT